MSNNHYVKKMKDGTSQESINFYQGVMGDKFQYGCWFNVLKYPVRAYDKHDSPVSDIKKTMHYCLFWLNDLYGNLATDFQDKLFDLFCDIEGVEKSKGLEVVLDEYVASTSSLEEAVEKSKGLEAVFDEYVASTSSLEEAVEKFYNSGIWRMK